MDNKDLNRIQNLLGYQFKNRMLLQQAFIRRSYAKEHPDHMHNEILEFIGDQVLGELVVKHLTYAYGGWTQGNEFRSRLDEGQLTEVKRKLVEKKMLAHRIEFLGLHEYLIMGKGECMNNVHETDSAKEDLFEAILGAVALDSQWNRQVLTSVLGVMLAIDDYLICGFGDDSVNYVELLQEWFQRFGHGLPEYQYRELYRQDNRIECRIGIPRIKWFEAFGNTKALARMGAARAAYEYLAANCLLYTMEDEIGDPDYNQAINQLQELAQKGYIDMPNYEFKQLYDANGNPYWVCTCKIPGFRYYFESTKNTKKDAKKDAAFCMLKHVLSRTDPGEDEYDDDDWYDDDD